MKFVSWNVNGLRACEGKGFSEIFKQLDADFFCLQETKMQAGQLDLLFEGYESYWNYADKKGYSGTAIFAKKKAPVAKLRMVLEHEYDEDGNRVAPDEDEELEDRDDDRDVDEDEDVQPTDDDTFYSSYAPEADVKDEDEDDTAGLSVLE